MDRNEVITWIRKRNLVAVVDLVIIFLLTICNM